MGRKNVKRGYVLCVGVSPDDIPRCLVCSNHMRSVNAFNIDGVLVYMWSCAKCSRVVLAASDPVILGAVGQGFNDYLDALP